MSDWMNYQLAQQRRAELIQQAQQEHLAQMAAVMAAVSTASPEPETAERTRQAFYAPILARLGDRLLATGAYLKVRYGECASELGELTTPALPEPSPR